MSAARSSHATRMRSLRIAMAVVSIVGAGAEARAATLPEIRLSAQNTVPACVTPDRLMSFLKRRNATLPARLRDIAVYYKQYGEVWRVRWDYAFFQMAIETNFLTYRRPDGRMGDVDPLQNNFAGIGTTGGGVPGDRFPDVKTGVLGQIQHLVVYSGETIANPVAPRTQLKQEHILAKSRELNRAVRFSDLAGRWAADRKYGGSIEWVAEQYRSEMCGPGRAPRPEAEVLPWQQQPGRTTGRALPRGDGARSDSGDTGASPASAVRTVWSRDGETSPPAKGASPLKAVQPAKVSQGQAPAASDAPVVSANTPGANTHASNTLGGDAAGETDSAPFALFTPPAGLALTKLASAKLPSTEPPASDSAATDGQATDVSEAANAATPSAFSPDVVSLASRDEPQGPHMGAGDFGAGVRQPSFDPIATPRSGLGVKPLDTPIVKPEADAKDRRCVIEAATYGGETTVLVKSAQGADVHYIALSVLAGFEANMTQTFISARPEGGEAVGTFATKDEALTRARQLCPAG